MSVVDTASGAGLRFRGAPRAGRVGHWWRAYAADGTVRGALRVNPKMIAAPGAVDRVVAAVVATRGLPGVLPVADLVSDAGQVWLITRAPAVPTVADLLGNGLDATAALTIARDTGAALADLHRAGLAHGAFGPDTVVVGAAGQVWLSEAGLVPALQNVPVPPGLDTYAWAALVRTLAGRVGDHPAVDVLYRCAATAEQAGLAAAVSALDDGAAALRVQLPERKLLAAAAARADTDAGADAAGREPDGDATGREPVTDPADQETQLGQRARGRGHSPDAVPARLRFGPGVGAVAPPPTWQAASKQRRRRPRRGRLRALASGLVTLALVGAVAAYLWQRQENPLVVTGAAVAPAEDPGDQCDVTVDVVGTIQANGEPGTVTYQWIRSDGETSEVLDQSVPSGRFSTQVHLFWSFSGQGRYDATATLRILAPTRLEASGQFTYACG